MAKSTFTNIYQWKSNPMSQILIVLGNNETQVRSHQAFARASYSAFHVWLDCDLAHTAIQGIENSPYIPAWATWTLGLSWEEYAHSVSLLTFLPEQVGRRMGRPLAQLPPPSSDTRDVVICWRYKPAASYQPPIPEARRKQRRHGDAEMWFWGTMLPALVQFTHHPFLKVAP